MLASSSGTRPVLAVLLSSVFLVACAPENDNTTTNSTASSKVTGGTTALIIDASSYDDYVYYNLTTKEKLTLTSEEAAASTQWHIGFRRADVILNGGGSGAGSVKGALAVDQSDFYTNDKPNANVFLNASSANELEHLTAKVDTSGLTYVEDKFAAAIKGSAAMTGTTMDLGWYNYNVSNHQLSVNSDHFWLLKSASGDSYARFKATALEVNANHLEVSLSFDVQAKGASNFVSNQATFNASVPSSGGRECFDFDTNSKVDCETSEAWDLQLQVKGRAYTLLTNSGPSGKGKGAAFGPLAVSDMATYPSGTLTSTGTNIGSHYKADATAGIFKDSSWYAYGVSGGHKLWPNYRVYVIDIDGKNSRSEQYKLQITNYYSDTGASGYPNIRFVSVAQ